LRILCTFSCFRLLVLDASSPSSSKEGHDQQYPSVLSAMPSSSETSDRLHEALPPLKLLFVLSLIRRKLRFPIEGDMSLVFDFNFFYCFFYLK
jgi:hypothetical protein